MKGASEVAKGATRGARHGPQNTSTKSGGGRNPLKESLHKRTPPLQSQKDACSDAPTDDSIAHQRYATTPFLLSRRQPLVSRSRRPERVQLALREGGAFNTSGTPPRGDGSSQGGGRTPPLEVMVHVRGGSPRPPPRGDGGGYVRYIIIDKSSSFTNASV